MVGMNPIDISYQNKMCCITCGEKVLRFEHYGDYKHFFECRFLKEWDTGNAIAN